MIDSTKPWPAREPLVVSKTNYGKAKYNGAEYPKPEMRYCGFHLTDEPLELYRSHCNNCGLENH